MGAGGGVRTIPHVIDSGGSCVCAGACLLAVIVTSSTEQSVGAWTAGSLGSLSANGANGLLLHVTR
jgi:hypothetical protein